MNPLHCSEPNCLQAMSTLSEADKQNKRCLQFQLYNEFLKCIHRCYHLSQALLATEIAPQYHVRQEDFDDLSQPHRDLIKRLHHDSDLVLFTLPGGNICVPTHSEDGEDYPYTHVINGKVLSKG